MIRGAADSVDPLFVINKPILDAIIADNRILEVLSAQPYGVGIATPDSGTCCRQRNLSIDLLYYILKIMIWFDNKCVI